MPDQPLKSTVYFDGACPLCRTEIVYYRKVDQDSALCFVDVSDIGAETPDGVSQSQAMARFHVRASDGRVLSGAAAFVEVWARLPKWRWAAKFASLPGVRVALEFGYSLFLPVRPLISRMFARALKLRAVFQRAARL